jgi:hypothetical protein
MATHKFSATDISEDCDVDSKRNTKGEGDVDKLADIRCRVRTGCQVVGASCVERNLCAGKRQGKKHERSHELSKKGRDFRANGVVLSSIFRGRCGGAVLLIEGQTSIFVVNFVVHDGPVWITTKSV